MVRATVQEAIVGVPLWPLVHARQGSSPCSHCSHCRGTRPHLSGTGSQEPGGTQALGARTQKSAHLINPRFLLVILPLIGEGVFLVSRRVGSDSGLHDWNKRCGNLITPTWPPRWWR